MAKKNKIPAMPFSTADWLRCPELKVLSPDVRGLWMDMLCYMWESPVRGVMVKPNGEIFSKAEIIRLLGFDSTGSSSWLDKLIEAKVCSIRNDGAIISRRMVRDVQLSEKRRNAGKMGGSCTLKKYWENGLKTETSNVPVNDTPEQNTVQVETPDMTLFQSVNEAPELTPEQQAKADKAKKYKYADYVSLTRDEYAKLCSDYSEDDAKGIILVLDNYKGQNGKRYRSDYRAILNWAADAYFERKQKQENGQQRKSTKITSNSPETGGFGQGTTL